MNVLYIPRPIESWIKEDLGDFELLASYRKHSKRSGVWKIATASKKYFLKVHADKQKWHTEVNSYRNWLSVLESYIPCLEGVFEGKKLQGILTTVRPGIPLQVDDFLPEENILRTFYKAGQLARAVHNQSRGEWFGLTTSSGQPLDKTHSDPVDYFKQDFLKSFSTALTQNYLTNQEISLANWVHDNIEVFADESPVPINRDYSPDNWLIDELGELSGIIDFESMLWGLELDTFGVLWSRYFHKYQSSENVFFAGYGYNPIERKPIQSRIMMIKRGIEDICYGTVHKKQEYIESGRSLLTRVSEDIF